MRDSSFVLSWNRFVSKLPPMGLDARVISLNCPAVESSRLRNTDCSLSGRRRISMSCKSPGVFSAETTLASVSNSMKGEPPGR
ncbi:hypothetical protein D3C76_1324010 [compost metagenome]